MPPAEPPLPAVIPPLIFGTATFNYQYNTDPHKLPTTALVHKALSVGVRAFDTSPYYGPAEEILGQALLAPYQDTNAPFPRDDYFLITKVGRLGPNEFNYSVSWVSQSIQRSLARLHTPYLDVVYCHDVEFVSPEEVLVAITELRRIRSATGAIKHIGISGYPVPVLCDLAEFVLARTGEPLDCVMSYANFTLQNRLLQTKGVERLRAAGVGVVPNASILGMGLLRKGGVPKGALGDWHPAPEALRAVCWDASEYCDGVGERLEVVAMRWALETWAVEGANVGSSGDMGLVVEGKSDMAAGGQLGRRLGVSVIGVSNLQELDETMRVWNSVLDGLDDLEGGRKKDSEGDHEWSLARRDKVRGIATTVWDKLGEWKDFAWKSPGEDYVRVQSVKEEL